MNITRHEIPSFGKAYDLLDISFIILDQQLRIDYMNDAAVNLLQLTPIQRRLTPSFLQLWSALNLPPLLDVQGNIIHLEPMEINGLFLNWNCIAVMIDNEEKLFLLGKEVSENERMFQVMESTCENIGGLASLPRDGIELTNEQAFSEHANQVKTEFLVNMSHDLRTPLVGVIGMAQRLEDNLHDVTHKQYAHWLGESGKQLLHMLNGILDVVFADNMNEADLHEEPFNLPQVIVEIEQLERPSTLLKGLDLVTKIDEAIPACLIGDATKIHRILLNLLGNAIKFTQVGRIDIAVSLVARSETRALIRFCITDTGIGIPEELQDKVFNRFYRVTPANQETYAGHGVGLHIAQSYVALLGGDIQVTSELGKGTTFHFELSLKIGDATAKRRSLGAGDDINEPVRATSTIEAVVVRPNLLLVEDNKIALLTLENLISQAGYQSTSVMDGESALHLAQTQSFDLIITDLGLPGLSGIELTQKIRKFEQEMQKKPIPIIGLTAHSEETIKRSCLDAGMNEVFTKPMTLEILVGIKESYCPVAHNAPAKTWDVDSNLPAQEEELFQLDVFRLFNVQRALEDMGGDISLLKNILTSIVDKEIPADLLALKKAYGQGDWRMVQKLAHRMKSGFVYCGAEKLVQACQYLERYNKAGHTSLLEPLYQQLLGVVEDTASAMRSWLLSN